MKPTVRLFGPTFLLRGDVGSSVWGLAYAINRDHLDIVLITHPEPLTHCVTRALLFCARTERAGSDLKVTQPGPGQGGGQDKRQSTEARAGRGKLENIKILTFTKKPVRTITTRRIKQCLVKVVST